MTFKEMLAQKKTYLAPAVFNPLAAKLAKAAGFEMLYLSAGVLGYVKCNLEANMSLPELVQAGVEMRAASGLPLILDGACGFGDPMHMHHTVALSEAAGFCAIEIEDQLLPKRAHHHVGVEHMIPQELMVAKVREAVAERRNPDFAIIARTNGVRSSSMDDALRRAEAYRKAGADVIYISPRTPEEARTIAQRLPGPFMFSVPGEDVHKFGVPLTELGTLGYRILTVTTPIYAYHRAMQQTYRSIADGTANPVMAGTTRKTEQAALHDTIGLDALLAIEKATVEK
jgi:2-methylisocitrate lyase-like PEP mutase family enzyme